MIFGPELFYILEYQGLYNFEYNDYVLQTVIKEIAQV